MIRVIVVDDQAIVRDGLVVLLGLLEGIEVVGEAADGAAAVRLAAATSPDVVLMDLRMPVLDGVGATEQIVAEHPATAVLVLTTFADDESIADALRAGAQGYLTKDAGRTQLETAIRSVAAGQTALASDVGRRVFGRFASAEAKADGPKTVAGTLRARFPELTPREAEVLELMAGGTGNEDIATELFISRATVKSHVNAIFAKLHTTTRAATIALVRDGGERYTS